MIWAYLISTASKQCHGSQLITCNENFMQKQKASFICAKNFPGLVIPHKVNNEVYLSYLYFTHYLLQVSVTQIQQ